MPDGHSASLTYLGAAGWRIEAGGFNLLIDPYFTRMSMRQMLFGHARPDAVAIRQYIPPARVILATHPHHDHLMDIPLAAQITGAMVYASPQGCQLLDILGLPPHQVAAIDPEDRLSAGPMQVSVYATPHRRILGRPPYQGVLRAHLKPPLRASDYRMDYHYSFLIEIGPVRMLVASGIEREPAVQADILLFGADATSDQISRVLQAVRPRIVFPNHWDDMFRSLSAPVRPMTAPSQGFIPLLRRIDLHTFERTIQQIAPQAQVILPRHFHAYPLA